MHYTGQAKIAKHGTLLAGDEYIELGGRSANAIEKMANGGGAHRFQVSMTYVDRVQILESVHSVLNLESSIYKLGKYAFSVKLVLAKYALVV